MKNDINNLYRLKRRCERLLELIDLNSPNIVIKNEIRLINESTNQLNDFLDYSENDKFDLILSSFKKEINILI